MAGERSLAAIMFTDIVGYTHLAQADESLALELLEEHRLLLRPVIEAHGGTEVKTIGDSLLLEFRSARDAVLCAVEMQEKMRRRNEEILVPARRLELRIGIHVGDVVHEKGDIYGDAVNVASRIEPLAEPGGICISQQVFDQIRNKTSLGIDKLGDVALKNVELPLGVYRINPDGEGRSKDERPPSRRGRLCVLPFVNISSDPGDDYFADGLTEELITRLSEIRGLKVIARTSAMSYKRKEKKVSEIARELDVDSIIEGSVRKAGNKVRITVQLVDAHSEEHMWSSRYDSELNDIFAIQGNVAAKVAESLSAGFFSDAGRTETKDIEAYTLYLKAIQLSNEGTEKGIKDAIALFERAISKDPKFARAYAALAGAWGALGAIGYEDFTTAVRQVEVAARKALELDPGLAESHSAMAKVHFMNDRFDAALKELEIAIRINPNDVDSHLSLGTLYSMLRGADAALVEFKRAYELDPLSSPAADMLALAAGFAGDETLEWDVLARNKEFNAKNPRVYISIAEYHMEKRDFDEAQRLVDLARSLGPDEPAVRLAQGEIYALRGRKKDAAQILDEILSNEKESVRLIGRLVIQVALGNLDEAFNALSRQAELHSWPYLITVDPFYAEMRKDPRFQEFRRRVGLPAKAAS
jgi:adenylate cyclase